MKVSDYIVDFFIKKGVKNVFGYPGGMVTHLMDSFYKRKEAISVHINLHEQACAFAACANAQVSNEIGVAFATSGPGAANLVTGIANAFFDSIPTIFITGQVNTYEQKGSLPIKQKGFQEMNVVSLVESITKYCTSIKKAEDIETELEKAYEIATSGRKGPVLLDIPMNIQRADIAVNNEIAYKNIESQYHNYDNYVNKIINALGKAKRPLIICGNGINIANCRDTFREFVNKYKIPVVTSMIAVDVLPSDNIYNYGFIGAYGDRVANILAYKADLIISMGSRLDCRQVGVNKSEFAKNTKIIRIDIDENEFAERVHENELQMNAEISQLLKELLKVEQVFSYDDWLNVCNEVVRLVGDQDDTNIGQFIEELSSYIPNDAIVTTDVGQNQVWVAQSFQVKDKQRVLFSGGLGSMGYSLPASIGAAVNDNKMVVSFNGDGGIQMNIQELNYISKCNLPIKIFVFNNKSLGMIRHFQELYFDNINSYTVSNQGFSSCDFCKIANAYGLESISININQGADDLKEVFNNKKPQLINVDIDGDTYVYPKSTMGHEIYDQEPFMDKILLEKLLKL